MNRFKVIHVESYMVVDAPQQCRYLCLSYVWGQVEIPRLTGADSAISDKYHKILDPKTLPKTVRDAIFILKELGERYLWTDCLCITQDDIQELAIAIRSMHRVYTGAVLTIVVAEGTNADHGIIGLPGLPRNLSWK